jgi:hypothetical protein
LLNNSGDWFRGVGVRMGSAWSFAPACTGGTQSSAQNAIELQAIGLRPR